MKSTYLLHLRGGPASLFNRGLLVLLFALLLPARSLRAQESASEELSSIKAAFTSFKFRPSQFGIDDFKVEPAANGEQKATWKMALHGNAGINGTANLSSSKKPKNIVLAFNNTGLKLKTVDSLAGKSLKEVLPRNIYEQAGLKVESLEIVMKSSGVGAESFKGKIGFNDIKLMEEADLSLTKPALDVTVSQPFDDNRSIVGTFAGTFNLGGVALNCAMDLSSKEGFIFRANANNVGKTFNLNALVNTMAGAVGAQELGAGITGQALSAINVNNLKFELNLSESDMNLELQSSQLGTVEIAMQNMKSQSRCKTQIGFATDANTDYSQIHQALGWFKSTGLNLKETAIVVSSHGGEVFLKGNVFPKDAELKKGLNITTGILLDESISSLIKVKEIDLVGSVSNDGKATLTGSVALNAELVPNSKFFLRKVDFTFGIEGTDIMVGMGCMFELTVGDDVLGLRGDFKFKLASLAFEARFLLQALSKPGAPINYDMIFDNDPPEWEHPFGIPCVSLREIGGSIGISPKSPVVVSMLGIKANVRVGMSKDKDKHLVGGIDAELNVADVMKSHLKINLQNATVLGVIEAFADVEIPDALKTMLNTGIEELMVDLDPANKRFAASGKFKMFGVGASIAFEFSPSGFSASGTLDKFEFGPDGFKLISVTSHDGQSGPKFSINVGTSDPHFLLDGSVKVLGIKGSANIKIGKGGLELHLEGNLWDGMIVAKVDLIGQALSETGGIFLVVSLDQSILKRLTEEAAEAVRAAAKAAQEAFDAAQEELDDCGSSCGALAFVCDAGCDVGSAVVQGVGTGLQAGMSLLADGIEKAGQVIGQVFDVKHIMFGGELTSLKLKLNAEFSGIAMGQAWNFEFPIDISLKDPGEMFKGIAMSIVDNVGRGCFGEAGSSLLDSYNQRLAAAAVQPSSTGVLPRAQRQQVPITDQQMIDAVKSRNTQSVKDLVNQGGNPLAPGLMAAAIRNKDLEMVKLLQTSVVKATVQDLSICMNEAFDSTIALTLINKGVVPDYNHLTKALERNATKLSKGMAVSMYMKGQTPLTSHIGIALSKNNFSLCKVLIQNGAKPDQNMLRQAIGKGDKSLIVSMIGGGAQPTADMLSQAIKMNDMTILRYMLDKIPPDQGAVATAIENKNQDALELLVRRGARITNTIPMEKAITSNDGDAMETCFSIGGSPTKALEIAMRQNKRDLIMRCLDNQAVATLVLDYAVRTNDTKFFTQLIGDYGANPSTAMDLAVKKNDINLATIALTTGGAYPGLFLRRVSDGGNEPMVKLLVENGADPNIALAGAVSQHNVSLVQYLIGKGASPSRPVFIRKAVELNAMDMVVLLMKYGAKPQYGISKAVEKNLPEMATFLLNSGASPKGLIAKPAGEGNEKMVSILLNFGAKAEDGMRPAVTAGKTAVAGMLLQYGASPHGYLAEQAGAGKNDMVMLLVRHGANPQDGLSAAVSGRHTTLVEFLLQRGAVPNGLLKEPATKGNTELVSLLANYGDDPEPGMVPAVEGGHVGVVDVLIKQGADPKKEVYMVTAVKKSYSALVTLLAKSGCPMTYRDGEGNTLLHMAAQKRDDGPTVKALIDAGADVKAEANNGNTPLQDAVQERNDNIESVNLLIAAGSDVNHCNKAKESILKSAKGPKAKAALKAKGALDTCL